MKAREERKRRSGITSRWAPRRLPRLSATARCKALPASAASNTEAPEREQLEPTDSNGWRASSSFRATTTKWWRSLGRPRVEYYSCSSRVSGRIAQTARRNRNRGPHSRAAGRPPVPLHTQFAASLLLLRGQAVHLIPITLTPHGRPCHHQTLDVLAWLAR